MTALHFNATCAAVVTLRVDDEATGPLPWDATLYPVEGTDLVDAIPLAGQFRPRMAPVTPAQAYNTARRHARDTLRDMVGDDELTVTWFSVATLARYRELAPEDTAGYRQAEGALFWAVMGAEPEDVPRDRSLPAVGLVNLELSRNGEVVKR